MINTNIYCTLCGALCSEKLQIEVRKGKLYPFCSHCFNKMGPKSSKDIRKIIREKNGLPNSNVYKH